MSCSLKLNPVISSVDIKASESFLRGGKWPSLTVDSAGHAVHVFVNGHFYGKESVSFANSAAVSSKCFYALKRRRICLRDKRKQKIFL